jgi:hypothetical protein
MDLYGTRLVRDGIGRDNPGRTVRQSPVRSIGEASVNGNAKRCRMPLSGELPRGFNHRPIVTPRSAIISSKFRRLRL